MSTGRARSAGKALVCCPVLVGVVLVLASCGAGRPVRPAPASSTAPATSSRTALRPTTTVRPPSATITPTTTPTATTRPPNASPGDPQIGTLGSPLPAPVALASLSGSPTNGDGTWAPAGRTVGGVPAVYETMLVPPGGTQPAGIAWMDTRLLSARLYSGSESPGGGPYRYTAPVEPAQAASLVAVFNGGFYMNVARGGYYTEGRVVDPLVAGAASLVIDSDGNVDIGAWGTDVTMTASVVSVRQNLVPLVAGGQPTPQASSPDWATWGATCGATSCGPGVPGVEHQWRSGLGVAADGALVYVTGPALDPLQLAQLLVTAGSVRGMQLDINPDWTVLATYDPAVPGGLAAPSNGSKLLSTTVQGPWTFFEPGWARDFVTMSARPAPTG